MVNPDNGLSSDKAFLFEVLNTDIWLSVKVLDPQKLSRSSGMKLHNFLTNGLRYEVLKYSSSQSTYHVTFVYFCRRLVTALVFRFSIELQRTLRQTPWDSRRITT